MITKVKNLNWRGMQINNGVFRQYSMYIKVEIPHKKKNDSSIKFWQY